MHPPHHIALPVSDLERSAAFYALLGFTNIAHWERPEKNLRALVLEDKKHGLRLELVSHPDYQNLAFPPLAELLHIGIVVDDVERLVKQLHETGTETTIPVSSGITVKKYAFVRDPDGFPVELLEYNENHPYAPHPRKY